MTEMVSLGQGIRGVPHCKEKEYKINTLKTMKLH